MTGVQPIIKTGRSPLYAGFFMSDKALKLAHYVPFLCLIDYGNLKLAGYIIIAAVATEFT